MSAINAELLEEAADWAVTLYYDDNCTDEDRLAFQHWLEQSPEHVKAWEHCQASINPLGKLPKETRKPVVEQLATDLEKRRSLKVLSMLFVAAPVGGLVLTQMPWQRWTADHATAIGERQKVILPEGSEVVLNTDSALDVHFDKNERRIQLRKGEILVTTHEDNVFPVRPLSITTVVGSIRALGTKFSVRDLDDDRVKVAVYEGAVRIQPSNGLLFQLDHGEQATFSYDGLIKQGYANKGEILWGKGIILLDNMRLVDVVQELSRYRFGYLGCAPEVAELRVSGSLSIADTDSALEVLATSFPIRIRRFTEYWVQVLPAV